MENYWTHEVPKKEWINDIVKSQNLKPSEAAELDKFIVNDPVTFYIVFERNELKVFLAYDGLTSTMPTQVGLSSSIYDEKANTNTHILVVNNPKTRKFILKAVFTEDFNKKKLYTDGKEVVGFSFANKPINLNVYPPLGSNAEPNPVLTTICCSACGYVHAGFGISGANCICCLGGCGFKCYISA
jgi:hypothetical protein